ncbi:YdgH/BhsA/McbA-like domain containing protein [Edaphovirga cremea]|uniref:YdgH/BhsA/McbA-like domain containing protein n=1 Tax=Edaphovirga cremea TaxID=2267246 RepID=UPI000DEEBBF9|nr:YdgH/BhsA/McbA-like domain containing protein [Edaphovirga cremea]
MKLLKAMTALILLGVFSAGAMSAQLLTEEEFAKTSDQYMKVGNVVTDGETAPSDAKDELSDKADKLGGEYYVIKSANTNEKIHASADVYKKK